ncbi:TPA: hypothetical protein NEI89_001544 [Escherichia coli]|uniref:hypothetical protein n=1 Tax=Escherichia coli TaxID=562 RepID=UPI00194352FB|nr:hypothetical protein [Escherichia coli]MDO1969197.1 hypothetical protein [Escherichia coli]HCD9588183.1 hypothetical protein [Escherichia coli]HDN3325546.1 hypothetical protein [Escherichia coli]
MEARTIPVTLFIHYATSTFSHEKLLVATVDMPKNFPDRYILLESREIEITVNQPEPIDIIGLQVEQLREQKQKTVADAQQRIAAIDDKIQQLLCIEYTPDTDELPY